jgi:flagellar protein FlaJ
MEAGEEVGRFLLDEQSVVMSDYESMYNSSLDKMRDIRDLFLSIIVSSVFLVVLSIVMPFVVGLSPFTLIGIGALVFVVSEVGFILGAEFIMPDDPIWLESSMKTSRDRRIKNVQILSLTLFSGLVVFSVLHLFFGIFPSLWSPLPVYLALPLTPLALPGFIVWWEEKRIRNKDSGFPGFLRTLSASASAKQATAVDVLGIFKGDEFGVLAPDVENLHKRLRIRIDEKLSWDYFFADTGSHLIERFGNMYFEGVTKGGDPKTVGDVITENFKRILRIREKRYGFVSSLIGVLYGVAVIAAATFFIGFCFVNEMIEGVEEVIGEFGEAFRVFRVGVYDIPGVHFMLTGLILANALLITFYIRAVGSSHDIGYYAHAVILLWLGIVTGLVVERFMGQLIAV